MKKDLVPAIIIGTHTMGLGVIRALGKRGVPIVAVYYNRNKDMGYASKYVTHKVYAPHPERSEDEFLSLLMGLIPNFGGSLLLPVSDEAISIVSQHKDMLASYYIVACTEWEITKQYINKKHTYKLATLAGVAAPKTFVPQSLDEMEQFGKEIEYPCLVKPCQSHLFFNQFGKKMVRVKNFEHMLRVYKQSVDVDMEVMLQEIIPGDDSCVVNYNSYFWDNKPLVSFTAQQIRKAPPEFGSPCVAVSKHIPEVIEPGSKTLKAMGFYGYSCIEFKKDPRDGIYKLMEVNGRHNLSTLLAVNSGIDFPWLHYRHLVDGHLPEQNDFQDDLFWIDSERDLPYLFDRIFKYKESARQFILPYISHHIFAVYDREDLKPFYKRYANYGRKAFKSLFNAQNG